MKWIYCKDNFPPTHEEVLCINEDTYFLGHVVNGKWFCSRTFKEIPNITCWTCLKKPPKEYNFLKNCYLFEKEYKEEQKKVE